MGRESITGSQVSRQTEIQNKCLVFEPITHEDYALSGILYTVPLGQFFTPDVTIFSGAYEVSSSMIQIQKDIHVFDREQNASDYITDIGVENIVLVKETEIDEESWIEVHQINNPKLEFEFEINNLEERCGYKIEVLRSSSFGYEEVSREVKKDKLGRIISDTYLKYFDLEVDK